jgi:hypothetical protein
MRVIVLNTNNLVQDGQNNKLIYKFPNSVQFKNNQIAVSSVSMYYSWFNITNAYSNNTFSYTWVVGSTTTTYTITIPDGLYQITDLNNLLQYNMAINGTYLITNSGSNAYYAEFILNPTRYGVQINTYLVPTSLPSGYTTPSNWVGFPTQSFNPSITIPAKLNTILGYGAGFVSNQNTNNAYTPPTPTASNNYVSKNTSNTLSYLSNSSPNLQPNSSIYFSLSNINNPYSLPSSIIYSLVPQGDVGTLIAERPPQFMWNKMIDGTYNQLTLTFLGTDLQPIIINDPSMTILLTIKDGDELGGKS